MTRAALADALQAGLHSAPIEVADAALGAPAPQDGAPPVDDPLDMPVDTPRGRGGGNVSRGHRKLPDDFPVTPLGHAKGVFFYLDPAGQFRELASDKHTKLNLTALMGTRIDAAWAAYPIMKQNGDAWVLDKKNWDVPQLAQDLMKACAEIGVWNSADRIREPGGWCDAAGKLILHCGDVLYHTQGEPQPPGKYARHVYSAGEPMPRPAARLDDGAHGVAGRALLDELKKWNMVRGEIDPYLILGWVVSGIMGGALEWRSAIWVTGDKSTGKSTMQKLLSLILGDGLARTKETSAAGVWSHLGFKSLPVMVDELEAEADNRQADALIRLMRLATDGGEIWRGSANHTGKKFRANSSFMFSSINIPPLSPQDKSRLAIIDLLPLEKMAAIEFDVAYWADIGAQLRRTILDMWAAWPERFMRWRQIMVDNGHVARAADTFGTLLAAADLVLHKAAPDSDTLDEWRGRLRPENLAEIVEEEADWQLCLRHICGARAVDYFKNGTDMTVAEIIEETMVEDEANRKLRLLGLRGLKQGNDWTYLAVANSHHGCDGLFAGTKWVGGVWQQSLKRIPGAKAGNVMRIAGVSVRVVLIPVEHIVPGSPSPSTLTPKSIDKDEGGGA